MTGRRSRIGSFVPDYHASSEHNNRLNAIDFLKTLPFSKCISNLILEMLKDIIAFWNSSQWLSSVLTDSVNQASGKRCQPSNAGESSQEQLIQERLHGSTPNPSGRDINQAIQMSWVENAKE